MAIAFFVYYGIQLLITLQLLIRRNIDNYSALLMFVIFNALWALVFSPFNGFTRIDIAIALVIICYLKSESRSVLKNRPQQDT